MLRDSNTYRIPDAIDGKDIETSIKLTDREAQALAMVTGGKTNIEDEVDDAKRQRQNQIDDIEVALRVSNNAK